MRAISVGPLGAESVAEAQRGVASLRASLAELQTGQGALELQLKYSPSPDQLAALRGQLGEAQRALSRWEARLGRELEAIVGLQRSALCGSAGGGGARSSGDSAMTTPQASTAAFRPL